MNAVVNHVCQIIVLSEKYATLIWNGSKFLLKHLDQLEDAEIIRKDDEVIGYVLKNGVKWVLVLNGGILRRVNVTKKLQFVPYSDKLAWLEFNYNTTEHNYHYNYWRSRVSKKRQIVV